MENIDAAEVSDWLLGNDVTGAITIRKNDQSHAVMIPYEIFQIMHKQNRQAVRVEDLSEEELEAITKSTIPIEGRQYNDEVGE